MRNASLTTSIRPRTDYWFLRRVLRKRDQFAATIRGNNVNSISSRGMLRKNLQKLGAPY